MKTLLLVALLGLGSLQTAYMAGHPTVYSEKTECDVCQVDEFKEGDEVVVLPCHPRHIFHSRCINKALKDKSIPACPLCRAPVTTNIEVHPHSRAFIRFLPSALSTYARRVEDVATSPAANVAILLCGGMLLGAFFVALSQPARCTYDSMFRWI